MVLINQTTQTQTWIQSFKEVIFNTFPFPFELNSQDLRDISLIQECKGRWFFHWRFFHLIIILVVLIPFSSLVALTTLKLTISSFPILLDVLVCKLPLAETYHLSVIGSDVPHICKTIGYVEAGTTAECFQYASQHRRTFTNITIITIHLSFCFIYVFLSDKVTKLSYLLMYIITVLLIMDWERIKFAVSMFLTMAIPIASNDVVLLFTTISMLSSIVVLCGRNKISERKDKVKEKWALRVVSLVERGRWWRISFWIIYLFWWRGISLCNNNNMNWLDVLIHFLY